MRACTVTGQRTWVWDAGSIPFPHSFSLKQLQPAGFPSRRGEAEPLTLVASCPSQNRCLPRLSEERDGWLLSDMGRGPMGSQAQEVSPMAVRGAGLVSWEPGGPSWSAAAVESPPLTLPAAASAAAPFPGLAAPRTHGSGGSRGGAAAPAGVRVPVAPRLPPRAAGRAGGPAAAGR